MGFSALCDTQLHDWSDRPGQESAASGVKRLRFGRRCWMFKEDVRCLEKMLDFGGQGSDGTWPPEVSADVPIYLKPSNKLSAGPTTGQPLDGQNSQKLAVTTAIP